MKAETDGRCRVEALYVYPVKGLSAQPLTQVRLTRGDAFPHDRQLALARAGGRYRPGTREGLNKREFHALLTDARLAGVRTHLDVDSGMFTATSAGRPELAVDLGTDEGRERLLRYFAEVLDLPDGSLPVYATEPRRRFTDAAASGDGPMNWISVLNLASVRDFSARTGTAVNPLRFRANVLVDGLAPWAEFDLVSHEFAIGEVRMLGMRETPRCAATHVDPETGERDLSVLKLLSSTYDHQLMGFYAEVLDDGMLRVGDELTH